MDSPSRTKDSCLAAPFSTFAFYCLQFSRGVSTLTYTDPTQCVGTQASSQPRRAPARNPLVPRLQKERRDTHHHLDGAGDGYLGGRVIRMEECSTRTLLSTSQFFLTFVANVSSADLFKEVRVSCCRGDCAASLAPILCSVESVLTAPKTLKRGTATWVRAASEPFAAWAGVAPTVVGAAAGLDAGFSGTSRPRFRHGGSGPCSSHPVATGGVAAVGVANWAGR